MVRNPDEYCWSSYKYYLEQEGKPSWLYCHETLSRFSFGNPVKYYKKFIEDGIDDELEKFYINQTTPPILGNKDFIHKINSEHLSPFPVDPLPEHSNISKMLSPSVEDIIEAVAIYFKINSLEIKKNVNKTSKNLPRNFAIHLSLKYSGQNRKEISSGYENNIFRNPFELKREHLN